MIKSKNITYESHVAKYTISETSETSAGEYTCTAENSAGPAETTAKLLIQGKL